MSSHLDTSTSKVACITSFLGLWTGCFTGKTIYTSWPTFHILRLKRYIADLEDSIENTLNGINLGQHSKQWKEAINTDLKDMYQKLILAQDILNTIMVTDSA